MRPERVKLSTGTAPNDRKKAGVRLLAVAHEHKAPPKPTEKPGSLLLRHTALTTKIKPKPKVRIK
jgi:hypothetical protein